MVRDWEAMTRHAGLETAQEAHPVPSVPGRPARTEELPTGASRLLKAVRAPWSANCTYARGTMPGVRTGEVESVVVRLRRPGVRAWAAWVRKTGGKTPAWTFNTAQVADKDGLRILGSAEVTAMVKGGGSSD
jgi:hypothetical protein